MKTVILAAGEGSRLWPFTYARPKVMIPVANRPILEYVVNAAVSCGLKDILVVVGYKKEKIMSYFEDGKDYGAKIEYVFQKKQLGTAHALHTAASRIDGDFLLLAGDNIIEPKALSDLLKRKPYALLVTESEIPSKYGVVEIKDKLITRIEEKPKTKISNLISTGAYLLPKEILDVISTLSKKGINDMTDCIRAVLAREKIEGIQTSGAWIDAVYPWDLLDMNATALKNVGRETAGKIERNVIMKGAVAVGDGTIIRSGSYIEGPVIIGKGCDIGPGVCIYPSTSIGDNVTIGPFSTIQESLIMSDCSIGPGCFISHSVLGEGVRVESRFSASPGSAIMIVDEDVQELKNVGVFIGEDTSCGDGVAATPGSMVGAGSRVSPLRVVSGRVPDGSVLV